MKTYRKMLFEEEQNLNEGTESELERLVDVRKSTIQV